MFDALQIEVHFQPVLPAGAQLPLAWHAETRVRGAGYAAAAAALPPELRSGLQARRVAETFEAAIAAGLHESGALLIVPICAAAGDPDAMLAHLFRTALVHRFPTDRLVIEVSADERADRDRAAALVQACGRRGLMVGLDGFAAGPVALGLLAHFTPHLIRLDPALVRRIDASEPRRRIVDSVLRLARGMGVTVIAPGVGHRGEIEAATALGIRYFQGDWADAAAIQPLPQAQPPRREPRSTQPVHRRLAHHHRAAATRPLAPMPGIAQLAS